MRPYIYGNFLIALVDYFGEGSDPYGYVGKFYLGSEIDYDTWRD
jgi:hypothetical protein